VLLTNNLPPLAVFIRPSSNKRPTALEKNIRMIFHSVLAFVCQHKEDKQFIEQLLNGPERCMF